MAKANFTARNKNVSIPLEGGGTYVGRISKITPTNQVFVEVPTLSPKYSFGPCVFFGYVPDLELNQKVVCTFLNNSTSDLVILGGLGGGGFLDGGTA